MSYKMPPSFSRIPILAWPGRGVLAQPWPKEAGSGPQNGFPEAFSPGFPEAAGWVHSFAGRCVSPHAETTGPSPVWTQPSVLQSEMKATVKGTHTCGIQAVSRNQLLLALQLPKAGPKSRFGERVRHSKSQENRGNVHA